MEINNIRSWFCSDGSFNTNSFGNAGFEWPKGSGKYARFVSGIWLGAKVQNETLITHAFYDAQYLPGYIDSNGTPQGRDDPDYRIYSIVKGDTLSQDYLNWPSSQGAYLNSSGRPYFLGTQTMFYSITDGYPDHHGFSPGNTDPLKAQILQTNWAYSAQDLKDVIFTEFRIINRSNEVWNNAYFGFWTDDDVGYASDDGTGIDTLRNLTYVYNFDNFDPQYGEAPPCVGTLLLRSPVKHTGNPSDTVSYYHPPGSMNLVTKQGFAFTGLNAFNVSGNQYEEPRDYREAFRFFEGKQMTGEPWINPVTGQVTVKLYSGDPVTGTGWINLGSEERRVMTSYGNITMMPGDTQSLIVAQLIARGSNNINSITKLRELSDYVQSVYDKNFQTALSAESVFEESPASYSLGQNFPNPFNPVTTIIYDLPNSGFVMLKVYDMLGREVKTLVNEMKTAGFHKAQFTAEDLATGAYFYRLSVSGSGGEFTAVRKCVVVK
ncbi:MAG: T9SS type A sorting domain-containing protein [Ignavibacteria bacterium]|nr:T9SS type A sorting domain-containing protein [Ignavibacteria bacterium]